MITNKMPFAACQPTLFRSVLLRFADSTQRYGGEDLFDELLKLPTTVRPMMPRARVKALGGCPYQGLIY